MLRRVAAASVFPVTLPEAKLHCRVDGSAEDALLNDLIATANEVIGEDTGLVLGVETWALTLTDAHGVVHLPKAPVSELVSVEAGGDELPGFSLTMVDGDAAFVAGPWPEGEVVVTFKAGGAVPLALKRAMLLLVAYWYEHREGASDTQVREIPYAVESLVARHRRGWVKA